MKTAAFTIVKNAVKFDYPIAKAITSVLPLCDEFVGAVGMGDDDIALSDGIRLPNSES